MPHLTQWVPSGYKRLTYENYRAEKLFHDLLDFDALDYARLHAALFFATNAVRARHSRSVLAYHPLLEQAARLHAQRMVTQNFLAHDNPYDDSLRTVEDRVRSVGVVNPEPTENIATYFGIRYRPREPVYRLDGGQGRFSRRPGGPPIAKHTYLSFAEAVVDLWMHSPEHRHNILAREAQQMGCGGAFYWDEQGFPKFKTVQVFQWFEPIQGHGS
jgi:uncharacterized protein YkwD